MIVLSTRSAGGSPVDRPFSKKSVSNCLKLKAWAKLKVNAAPLEPDSISSSEEKHPTKPALEGGYSSIVRNDFLRALAVRQTDLPFANVYFAVSTIPHLLSFSTPEHGRSFCSVEAKLGLSFL